MDLELKIEKDRNKLFLIGPFIFSFIFLLVAIFDGILLVVSILQIFFRFIKFLNPIEMVKKEGERT